jgi:RNA polymerase sigma-70 factor (ECF subfamily)
VVTKDTFGRWETEQQLWLALRQGDEQAFTFIFEKYHRTLYNYGSKLTSHTAVTEDAIQDIFIDIWRLRSNLTENISSIKFYLYRTLRRRIHQTLDRYPATEEISDISEPDMMPLSFSDSQTLLIETESSLIRTQRIRELLAQLPERQLEAVTLRYFDEFSVEEISQIMGVSEKSVRNFLYKALTLFRQAQNFIINFLVIICSLSIF